MENYLGISEQAYALGREAERKIAPYFARLEEICDKGTEKVLAAFRRHRVSDTMFAGTTGYGYDDQGRDTLDKIYADIFGAEAGLVRIGFVNGTHTLSCAMFSAVKTGDVVLSVTSAPYDTLMNTITGDCPGSMKCYGIGYRQVDLKNGLPDLPAIEKAADDPAVKLVFIQRSRGYAVRQTLSCEQIGEICKENASYRMTAPGIGGECGCTMGQNRLLYQGLFLAPHVTMQAVKTAIFCAQVMQDLGFAVDPLPGTPRYDIIQTIAFGAPAPLRRFCEGIQSGAPVDSYVTPEPWAMPGYDDPVIMAAGAFVQGASIELSADAPMREPYVCYMQGGLTYSSGKAGILLAAERLMKEGQL